MSDCSLENYTKNLTAEPRERRSINLNRRRLIKHITLADPSMRSCKVKSSHSNSHRSSNPGKKFLRVYMKGRLNKDLMTEPSPKAKQPKQKSLKLKTHRESQELQHSVFSYKSGSNLVTDRSAGRITEKAVNINQMYSSSQSKLKQ